MARTKEERLRAVHEAALREFEDIQSVMQQERRSCLEDRRFYSLQGGQWEGALGDQFANKPRLEMNKVHLAVIRIINEYRRNRITVDFIPKDGETGDKMADTCDGLYRADEQDSCAQEAYDNAFEEAVGGGFGAWRLRACYEDDYDDENDKQRIKMEPIFDADTSVFFDLNAKRRDKSDATRCFVLTAMSPSAYAEEYDEDPAGWPSLIKDTCFDWYSPDVVYIAEYYKVEEKTETVHVFRGLDDKDMMVPAFELEDDPEKLPTLLATGFREVRQKKIKRRAIRKYIMNGVRIIADEGIIAGKCIPVIPVYGKRWFVDNVERCMGHVRLAKDAQRLANMLRSNLAEIASMSAREKPIFTPEQISGHANMWANDNVLEYPYLLVNKIEDANGQMVASGPVGYTKASNVPPALAALMQVTEQDLSDLLGNQQAGEQMQPNISGKAVELIQNKLDMQAFIYMDNMSVAMRRCGEVWLSMSKDLIVEENRRMKTVNSQGEAGSVVVNEPAYDTETGEETMDNDMSEADFDVVPTVGPSSDSKRATTVRQLTGLMQITQDPEMLQVLGSMALMNMEGENMGDLRQWVRKKMVAAGVVEPNDEEREQMAAAQANQQPDANTVYLLASAKKQEADAEKSRTDMIRTLADAELRAADVELRRAQTAKTFAEVGETAATTVNTQADTTGQRVETAQSVAPENGAGLAEAIGALVQQLGQKKPSRIAFERDANGDIIGAAQINEE